MPHFFYGLYSLYSLYIVNAAAVAGLYYTHQQANLDSLNWQAQIFCMLINILLAGLAYFWQRKLFKSNKINEFNENIKINKKNTVLSIFVLINIFCFFALFFHQYANLRALDILKQNQGLKNIIQQQINNKEAREYQIKSSAMRFQIIAMPKFFNNGGGQVLIQKYPEQEKLLLYWSEKGFWQQNIINQRDAVLKKPNDNLQFFIQNTQKFYPIVGEIYQANLDIKPIQTYANPQSVRFDKELQYFQQGIQFVATLKPQAFQQKIKIEHQSIKLWLEYARQRIRDILLKNFSQEDIKHAGIFLGLVLGDTNLIDEDSWQLFQTSGIAHLIAISGLHITLIFHLSKFLVLPILRTMPFLYKYANQHVYTNSIGLVIAGIYTLLSGLSIPAQRTFLMLFFAKFLQMSRFNLSIQQNLSWVMLIVLLFDPWAILSKGFLLSFLIVAMLMQFSKFNNFSDISKDSNASNIFKNSKDSKTSDNYNILIKILIKILINILANILQKTLKIFNVFKSQSQQQFKLNILLIPISILIFSQLSLISPIANLIAIPVITYIVTPLALLLSFFNVMAHQFLGTSSIVANILEQSSASVWHINDQILDFLLLFCENLSTWFNQYAQAMLDLKNPDIFLIFSGLCGCVLLFMPYRWRYAGVLFFLPFFMYSEQIKFGEFKTTVLDVGQGTAIVVQTQKHVLVFDSAGVAGSTVIAKQTLIPFLKQNGVQKIDYLIISHADLDHAAGLEDLIANFKIINFYSSASRLLQKNFNKNKENNINTDNNIKNIKKDFTEINDKNMQRFICTPNTWTLDGIAFSLLAPINITTAGEENADSCVLKVYDTPENQGKNASILFTADIGAPEELNLIQAYQPEVLKTDVLLAGHHGSRFSSHNDFIKAVQPQIAISQNGFLNRYRHPHPDVLERFKQAGVVFYRTDLHGAITIFRQEATSERLENQRYWMFNAS